MKKVWSKGLLVCLTVLSVFGATITAHAVSDSVTTPYTGWKDVGESTGQAYQGAEYEVYHNRPDFQERIDRDLPIMKSVYNINTLNVYGLENLSQAERHYLFDHLPSGMKVVARIEWYDPAHFNFNVDHVDDNHDGIYDHNLDNATTIVNYYDAMIQDICQNYSGKLAYFALNMPVDDGIVASHFAVGQYEKDGRKNPDWKNWQVPYIEDLVMHMRAKCASYGYAAAKLYVSVFYGWDGAYDVLPYTSSNADGYFFNMYTYPYDLDGNNAVREDYRHQIASTDTLLNTTDSRYGLNKFRDLINTQYPYQNKVFEFGFSTCDFIGKIPNQKAGLMGNLYAKQDAMQAYISYINSNFTNTKGGMYFGYNLIKTEGDQGQETDIDWCLEYPYYTKMEAESDTNVVRHNLSVYSDPSSASGNRAVSGIDTSGRYLEFFHVAKLSNFKVRYASVGNHKLSLYINGGHYGDLNFNNTGAWSGQNAYTTTTYYLNAPVLAGSTLKFQFDADDTPVNIDYIEVPNPWTGQYN